MSTNVRALAAEALLAVLKMRGVKPRDALEALAGGLGKRDRAFLMELLYGVLRRRDTLDWILEGFLKTPQRLDLYTLNNLRAGAYQIFYMRVPDWASVSEAVEAERKNRALVNAVLRNILREKDGIKARLRGMKEKALDRALPGPKRTGHIAVATSHPAWLVRRWVRRFGPEEAYGLAEANNNVPPITLRVNTLKAERHDVIRRLREMGFKGAPTRYSPEGIKLGGSGSFPDMQALRGLAVVQDEAAQLMTHLLAPEPGERVLDACAAPGGKTTHIAQMMRDTGEVVAVDINESRLKVLGENVSALGLGSVKVVQGDITRLGGLPPPGLASLGLASLRPASFDRVMLDAPCSATGVIRRNPDVKYRVRRKDLIRHREKQLLLLRSVSALLKPGGTLLFCTCSTEPEEGEEVAAEFLKTSGDFYIIDNVPARAEWGGLFSEGYFRTYPHRHDMDGFFGVGMKRVS
jgi:16S rRNA (cytosine967-C5)-methyltransferase